MLPQGIWVKWLTRYNCCICQREDPSISRLTQICLTTFKCTNGWSMNTPGIDQPWNSPDLILLLIPPCSCTCYAIPCKSVLKSISDLLTWDNTVWLTLCTITSVCIFSILFFIHFSTCWQGEFVKQSRASLVGHDFLYSIDFIVWFRGDIVRRN